MRSESVPVRGQVTLLCRDIVSESAFLAAWLNVAWNLRRSDTMHMLQVKQEMELLCKRNSGFWLAVQQQAGWAVDTMGRLWAVRISHWATEGRDAQQTTIQRMDLKWH